MQEQARTAQLQQQEQQAQAAREQQYRLVQQHAQLHRQAMEARPREHEHEQRHSQDTRPPQHEQRQAVEPMLHTPATTKAPHLALTSTHQLEAGDRGAAVQVMQQHLQTLGVTDRDGNAIQDDKHYGPRTQQAVENFQRLAGREPTGIADPGTLEALQTHAQFAARQKTQDLGTDRPPFGRSRPACTLPLDRCRRRASGPASPRPRHCAAAGSIKSADHAQPALSHSTDAVAERPAQPRPDLATAQQQAASKALAGTLQQPQFPVARALRADQSQPGTLQQPQFPVARALRADQSQPGKEGHLDVRGTPAPGRRRDGALQTK